MELKKDAKLLRIFLDENDNLDGTPLYEVIILEAREKGLAGTTAWKGVHGFGRTSRIQSEKGKTSASRPIVVEIVDEERKISKFLPVIHDLLESAHSGGLVTIEDTKVVRYI